MEQFDLIVIGSGPGGYPMAAEAASRGRRVAIIERDLPGGTCLNRGCIPTKALCRSAEVARTAADSAIYGVNVQGVSFDYSRAVMRKDEVIATLREGVTGIVAGCTYVQGEARFVTADTVEVDGRQYSAPQIVVATGSRPAMLRVPGAEYAVNSDFFLSMSELPDSAVIIGGGVIGMEMAGILSAFNVPVTVIEYCPEILPPFDAEVAKRLRMAVRRQGIDVVTGASVTAIEADGTVRYECKGKTKSVTSQLVVSAVGRIPVIPDGLVELGAKLTPRGALLTDEQMQTSIPGIYAVGDVNGRCMLAHAATAQGMIVLGMHRDLNVIPSAVFTHPELAMVGHTEAQLQSAEVNFVAGRATFRSNGKALAMGEPDGLVKVLIAKDDQRILGAHICGAHAADLIQEIATVMAAGLPADAVATAIHAHPTLGETVERAVEDALRQIDA